MGLIHFYDASGPLMNFHLCFEQQLINIILCYFGTIPSKSRLVESSRAKLSFSSIQSSIGCKQCTDVEMNAINIEARNSAV